MSSPSDDEHRLTASHQSKGTVRKARACDNCRKKKVRCEEAGDRCLNCTAFNLPCTYVESGEKTTSQRNIDEISYRLEQLERLVQKHGVRGKNKDGTVSLKSTHLRRTQSMVALPDLSGSIKDSSSDDEDDFVSVQLASRVQSMNIEPMQHRFFGKPSSMMLLQEAVDVKKKRIGQRSSPPEHDAIIKRPEYSKPLPWELAAKTAMNRVEYIFPDENLGLALVELYFAHANILSPILHRPTFDRKIADGAHLRFAPFGAVYLLVCAIGSRFSDDPRIFLEDTNFNEHSCGWKFFEQVQNARKTLLGSPCLEDLQVLCLSVIYLHGSSLSQGIWTLVGSGIRLAQDVGAHRREVYRSAPGVEAELWKRAFWVLIVFDRLLSVSLGRPCATQDEEFDIDLPAECDDEYWEHPDPTKAFQQPPNKPSVLSYFVNNLKLSHILAYALRTIYSSRKSKALFGSVGPSWQQDVATELGAALHRWLHNLPSHLRWDPSSPNDSFFLQSCCLYSAYYHVQIVVHRPFLPSPGKAAPMAFPSHAICINAARSCSGVIDIYRKRTGSCVPALQLAAFTAAIVLLVDIWGGTHSRTATDLTEEMEDVYKCMSFLQACEKRWYTAGRTWEALCELAFDRDLPLPPPVSTGAMKRNRAPDDTSDVVQPPHPRPPDIHQLPSLGRSRDPTATSGPSAFKGVMDMDGHDSRAIGVPASFEMDEVYYDETRRRFTSQYVPAQDIRTPEPPAWSMVGGVGSRGSVLPPPESQGRGIGSSWSIKDGYEFNDLGAHFSRR
ncbi:hypothetical protein BV22DRAFT_1039127 [Leucogyrophana mollusca]|uniref:Uncharacterized protein n=1 Tax=Leucogyrophana mollusca TaxID=85980 RepID=A0ACB8B5P0_9AGAM|nr:hypothetical protein BV22DRAFT_1039127 [Leucogyrophana mollusca]